MFSALCTVLVLALAPGGWDHAGFDAEDSYYNPDESQINAGTIGDLTQRWSVALREKGGACGGPSAPLISGGAGGSVIATDERGISSYRAMTGRLAWQFDWDDPDDSSTPSMAVSGDVLVAANSDCNSMSDPDGRIVALDLATGRVRWRIASPFPVASFVVDKGVVVVSGTSPSDEQMTVAYRAADGRELWRKPRHEASGVSANGRILLVKGRSTTAVAIGTGVPLWAHKRIWYAESATPAADRFLVSDGTALTALRASDGAMLWTAEGKQSALLATDGRRVYRAAERTVEALDVHTGRRLWWRQLPVIAGQPVRAGGLVYTGGPVLNAATGSVVATVEGSQVAAGGRLFTVSRQRLTVLE
ncbi:outer membrane protein assembly factor BamB family protein [Paractinoplanes deccanensis]|uniref:outer membrane protein assembly factor BamB family protein n=1 Tax=Paractinoplanes deccanensis TaxID=113561 RepID=UPI00194125C7|nr:PQQ-binding-like beta-propeller repeat protein [Actinoplanes deccanensis]